MVVTAAAPVPASSKAWPHCRQKRADALLAPPQLPQLRSRAPPQDSQKRESSSFALLQAGHSTSEFYRTGQLGGALATAGTASASFFWGALFAGDCQLCSSGYPRGRVGAVRLRLVLVGAATR